MNRLLRSVFTALAFAAAVRAESAAPAGSGRPEAPVADAGPFKPDWNSLASQYRCPDWFRDAKFGIWAHWGPQCQPEEGDWYARRMYIQGSKDYEYHVAHYGHPSQFGFKDVIHEWHAERFDPDRLLALYKQAGARYFMALANHHDNFDNYNSKYQPWNSVNMGPKKDLIGLWAAAARRNGLRFGVSVHAARAWTWYEPAQGADKSGPLASVAYDGTLTKADGNGKWWDGFDPQDLYAQNHPPGAPPDAAYVKKFFRRTRQLIDDYQPDLLYFDDDVLPLRRQDEAAGLELVAHDYNSSLRRHGRNEAVVNTKGLDPLQRRALVYDIERGKARNIMPEPWQTDTCIGDWHYDREIFEQHRYKPAATVVQMLVDIVSRNGNLMLNIPLRGDGTPDDDEVRILHDIGDWIAVSGDAIYATRPWKIFGEGPAATEKAEKGRFGGIADAQSAPYAPEDIRFTQSKDGRVLYAIALAWPASRVVTIHSLATHSPLRPDDIGHVSLLGSTAALAFSRDEEGLHVTLPSTKPCKIAFALRITS